MHLTRKASSKFWPIRRKGTKYLVVPSHNKSEGIPLLIIMREMLGFVKSKKELRNVLLEGKIKINEKKIIEPNYAVLLFDTINVESMQKRYRLIYSENKKFSLEEIKESEVNFKIVKVQNKKILKNKIQQINFNDGRNIISKETIKVGDSVMINLKSNKIEKILPIKEKSKIMIIKGKHIGKKGEIKKIEKNELSVKVGEHEIITNEKEIIVLG
jgi:small subunit ribosomal protein S4e